MKYPKDLLPRRYFRIFLLSELPKDPNYWIVRRSLRPSDQTFDAFGLLRVEAALGITPQTGTLNVKEVAGLSMNLLGGYFKLPHIRFRAVRLAMQNWDPAKPALKYSVIVNDIEPESGEPVPIFYRLNDVHNRKFPYTRNFDKDYKKKLPPEFQTRTGPNEVSAETEVVHKPSNANFWHVEFHVKDKLTNATLMRSRISNTAAANPQGSQNAHINLAKSALENVLIKGVSKIEKTAAVPHYVYVKPCWLMHRFCKKLLRPFIHRRLS